MNKLTVAISLGVVTLFFSVTTVLAAKPITAGENAASDRPSIALGANGRGNQASAPGKLKACQAREAAVKRRSAGIVRLTSNMVKKFSSISAQVGGFYNNTDVPQGKVVANYNALISDIQAKEASVEAKLQTAKDDMVAFRCTSVNPKQQLTTFRTDMQAVKQALKDFRTSVRNLIVAVHSVTGDENRTENGGQ